jgi:cell division protein FtsW
MAMMSARVPFQRLTQRGPIARWQQRLAARPALARPPAYYVVCATVGVLNIVGLVMILSASSVAALSNYGSSWYFFNRQLMWALVGVVAFVVASRVDYHIWRKAAPWLVVLAAAACTLVLVPGIGIYVDGSRRWLGAGFLRMQPSEIAKLALLVGAAEVLARRASKLRDAASWRPVLIMLGGLGLLVMKEPDLDSTIVLALIAFAVLIVGGVRTDHLVKLFGFAVLGATILSFAAPYRRARMFSFLHPGKDASNTGYQITQSLIALGSGGINGVGLGAGRAKWMFLPNAHTDFIFAIIGEELGFIGCVVVLGLFAGFGLVGFHVARRAPDMFGTLIAAGVTAWIVGQAAINLGAVIGVLPVSGITLPFLSAGGSSLVITMLGAGIVANVARHGLVPRPNVNSKKAKPKAMKRRVPARTT